MTFSSKTVPDEPSSASAQVGAWHTTRGRTVAPPDLSLPGPFVTAHYWTTLAAYLSTGEFEQGFLDGHGPAQVGLTPPARKVDRTTVAAALGPRTVARA